ncbi:thioredoxin family protein [Shouchella patagoniensis]|uniref:thioredoxin family protein n=1 Tax=Shouchella patagoniensis TaxID=228576 RepID=UPI0009951720|nr:thioredoxin family protein [Shouchella patagoniensis]
MIEQTLGDLEMNLLSKGTGWLYVYSPFCGTCKQAERMLIVIEESHHEFSIYKLNIQLAPSFALSMQIESVPALLYYREGKYQTHFYAFGSVVDIIEKIKEAENDVNGL